MITVQTGTIVFKYLVVASLSLLLISQPLLAEQSAAPTGEIKIVVVKGADAKNVTLQIAAKPLIVQIKGSNDRPIAGAQVEFAAPDSGPGGDFASDSPAITVTTDADGFASAGPYHPNAALGAYEIHVRASYQGMTSATTISQVNIASRSRMKLILIIALAAGAAGAAIAFHQRGGNTSAPTAPTITFGTGAVGAP